MELSLNHVSCGYRDHIVVEDMTCSFEMGKSTAIIGPNGIGKTTIMKAILRQNTLLSGTILVDHKDIMTLPLKQFSEYISYVPQNKNTHYNYSVIEVIMMGRSAYLPLFASPGEREYQRSMEVLDMLGMPEYENAKYSTLSGGEQQMVLIARALVQDSKFVLLDEPASNLDYCNQKKLLNTIIKLKEQGIGVVSITHSLEHAFLCSDKVLVINPDRSYQYGNTGDILTTENMKVAFNTDFILFEDVFEDGRKKRMFSLDIR